MNFEDLKNLISSQKFVLVDFYAVWCGPCKAMHSVLDAVQTQLGQMVDVVRLNSDEGENSDLVNYFRIHAVPTLILFRDGRQLWRHSGVMTEQQIVEELRRQERLEMC